MKNIKKITLLIVLTSSMGINANDEILTGFSINDLKEVGKHVIRGGLDAGKYLVKTTTDFISPPAAGTNAWITNTAKAVVPGVKSIGTSVGKTIAQSKDYSYAMGTGLTLAALYSSGLGNKMLNFFDYSKYEKMNRYPTAIPGKFHIHLQFDNTGTQTNSDYTNWIYVDADFQNNELIDNSITLELTNDTSNTSTVNPTLPNDQQEIKSALISRFAARSQTQLSPVEQFLYNVLNTMYYSESMLSKRDQMHFIIRVGIELKTDFLHKATGRGLAPITINCKKPAQSFETTLRNTELDTFIQKLYIFQLKDMTSTTNDKIDSIDSLNLGYRRILQEFYRPNPMYNVRILKNGALVTELKNIEGFPNLKTNLISYIHSNMLAISSLTFETTLIFIPKNPLQNDDITKTNTFYYLNAISGEGKDTNSVLNEIEERSKLSTISIDEEENNPLLSKVQPLQKTGQRILGSTTRSSRIQTPQSSSRLGNQGLSIRRTARQ